MADDDDDFGDLYGGMTTLAAKTVDVNAGEGAGRGEINASKEGKLLQYI